LENDVPEAIERGGAAFDLHTENCALPGSQEEVPRQETFNLARVAVLDQFLSQSETNGSIRNGNYIDLSEFCSVNACLTTVKLRHGRERYDRLVRGLLRIRGEAGDEQSRRHDLRDPNVKWLEFRF